MDWNLGTAVRTLWQEARGEPVEGQRAVAAVLVNRLHAGRWGATLASVCLWHAAFSGWFSPRQHDGKPFRDPNFAAACDLADDDHALISLAGVMAAALNGEDPTGGATHYYAKSIPAPDWVKDAVFCGRFGNQLFYKGVR